MTNAARSTTYLHSGEAVTLRGAVIDHNFLQHHERTLELKEIEDLLAYVRSL